MSVVAGQKALGHKPCRMFMVLFTIEASILVKAKLLVLDDVF